MPSPKSHLVKELEEINKQIVNNESKQVLALVHHMEDIMTAEFPDEPVPVGYEDADLEDRFKYLFRRLHQLGSKTLMEEVNEFIHGESARRVKRRQEREARGERSYVGG